MNYYHLIMCNEAFKYAKQKERKKEKEKERERERERERENKKNRAYTAYAEDRHWLYIHSNSILLKLNRMNVFYSFLTIIEKIWFHQGVGKMYFS